MWAVTSPELSRRKSFYTSTLFSVADQCDQHLLCQPTTHGWKPTLQHMFLFYHPNVEEMLIFGEEIFLDRVWKLLHHWGGWGKLPVVTSSPGVAVLGTRLEGREFPQVEHPLLCKRKLKLCHHGTQWICTWDEHASILCKRSTLSVCSLLFLSSPGFVLKEHIYQSSIKTHYNPL